MKTVDLLQVVYEHWAKPRDIEEKKILKSSIGSPLPTCLHCVICKSNNLFKSLFCLSLESVCLSDCRRIVSKWMHSGCQGAEIIYGKERIFFSCFKIYFYVKTWTGWANMLLVFVVTTVHILFVLHRPSTSVSLVKSSIFFFFVK